jgi:hypothetical protein
MAKAKQKTKPKTELATTDDGKSFIDAWERAAKKDATRADRAAFREHLERKPDNWRSFGDMVRSAERALIDSINGTGVVKEFLAHGCEQMRKELTQDGDGALEAMMIDAAVLAWLRLGITEQLYTSNQSGSFSTSSGLFWDKRLASAHKRFGEACTNLARVRKLRRPQHKVTFAQINQYIEKNRNGEPSPELDAIIGAMAGNAMREARQKMEQGQLEARQ